MSRRKVNFNPVKHAGSPFPAAGVPVVQKLDPCDGSFFMI